jgi:RNA methyltransferase, TrmH family
MPIRIVQSKQNARLKELRRALTSPGRKAAGLAGIEGPHLLEEAMRAGLQIRCVFADERMRPWVEGLELESEVDVLILPSGILEGTLSTETPQPVAALVDTPEWNWADVLSVRAGSPALVVVLAGLQDPGNLGTIVRSAEAFGASGVVCLPGTVSPWNQKALRASAGSMFRLPIVEADEAEAIDQLKKAGVRILTTAVKGAQAAGEADLASAVALVIGNEGNGVPAELAAKADGAVTIPCPGPVESLNAAVAAGVLLYEASTQRASKRHVRRGAQ